MRIVFVCLGHAGLSVIAENIINKMMKDYEINGFEFSSCGTHEIEEMHPEDTLLSLFYIENREKRNNIIRLATQEMSRISMENAYDEIKEPASVTSELLKSADLIITMDRSICEDIKFLMGNEVDEKMVLFHKYALGIESDGFLLSINYDYYFGVSCDFKITDNEKEELSNVFKSIEWGCYQIMLKLFKSRIVMSSESLRQDKFYCEGKRFVNSVKDYFERFEQQYGDIYSYFKNHSLPFSPNDILDPTMIVDQMSKLSYPEGYQLPLYVHGIFNEYAFLYFSKNQDFSDESGLRVKCCAMGAFQTVLLRVLSPHIMPLHCRAITREWNLILNNDDLLFLRMSITKRADSCHDTYASILPKNLPTEPKVQIIDNEKTYEVIFYVWCDFGGYIKVDSIVKFPSSEGYSLIKDLEIETNLEVIFPYNCGIHYDFIKI